MTDHLTEAANGRIDGDAVHAALDAMKAQAGQGFNDFYQLRKAIEVYAQTVSGVNRVYDWTVTCPHCDYVANGFRHCKTMAENPHWQLIWHVNEAHPDQTFICPKGGQRDDTKERAFWNIDRGHRHCSYCGSAHPDDVMAGVEDGSIELGPTDKSYKAYLTGGQFDHAKFYFQHLNPEQMDKFIELHNGKKMRIGYPGRFYVMPFFCKLNTKP